MTVEDARLILDSALSNAVQLRKSVDIELVMFRNGISRNRVMVQMLQRNGKKQQNAVSVYTSTAKVDRFNFDEDAIRQALEDLKKLEDPKIRTVHTSWFPTIPECEVIKQFVGFLLPIAVIDNKQQVWINGVKLEEKQRSLYGLW